MLITSFSVSGQVVVVSSGRTRPSRIAGAQS